MIGAVVGNSIHGALKGKSRAHVRIDETIVGQSIEFTVEFSTQLRISPTDLTRSNANNGNLFYQDQIHRCLGPPATGKSDG